jgi:hypothetical protein
MIEIVQGCFYTPFFIYLTSALLIKNNNDILKLINDLSIENKNEFKA